MNTEKSTESILLEGQLRSGIQLRGKCCICGKEHATHDGKMVHHGYTVSWGAFNDSCRGTHNPHIGDERAPAFIAEYITELEEYKTTLPEKIKQLKDHLLTMKPEKDEKTYTFSFRVNKVKREVGELENLLSGGLDEIIDGYKQDIENWTLTPLTVYDVEVAEKEERAKRQAVADEKKAIKAAKKAAAEARKLKAQENAEKREAALIANNYHRLISSGELIKEWEASYPTYRAMIDHHHKVRQAHYDEMPEPKEPINRYVGSIYVDVRSKPSGKGRILHKGNPYR